MSFIRIKPILLLLLVFLLVSASLAGRTVFWKPERILGSARLSLEDIRYIYLPPEPAASLTAAAVDLLEIWPGSIEQRGAETALSKQGLVLRRDARIEGFIYRRDRTRVYLTAGTDEELANGLYAICRELLGARWYWMGELGFESVGEAVDKFPEKVWRERPAFVQRTLYPVNTDFGRRNGLNRKYSFNHNLARIYTQEVYEASPEVFAEVGGERRSPIRSAKYDPQPNFTHPRAVDLAVQAARAHFQENPDANSFSLSINDNSLFDEGAETEAVVRGRRTEIGDRWPEGRSRADGSIEYFRGRPNYTDLVFGFMNQVAERLYESEKMKGRNILDLCHFPTFELPTFAPSRLSPPYLTALAYYWTEQSPSFQLHPRVMPVLTSDRAQWHDSAYRAQDKALIRRWADSGAERIATWDYYYGAPYPYPRQFTQWMDESIRYLHESGVDVFFSQLPSIWGLDGPKAWLTAELLRDPEQNSEALLGEYYENFFGAAAEPIRKFYELAEQTRNERAGTANWIKFYKDEAGIELFNKNTLHLMRDWLSEAEQLVSLNQPRTRVSAFRAAQGLELIERARGDPALEDRFAQRVRVVSEAFSYTESYAAYHRNRVQMVELTLAALRGDTRNVDGAALAQSLKKYQKARASFYDLKQVLVNNPMHRGFSAFNRLKQSEPVSLVLAALSQVEFKDPQGDDEMRSILHAWYNGEARLIASGKNSGLQHSGTELRNFLGPTVPVLDGWAIQYRASADLRITAASGQEASGLKIENADIVSLAQTYPVLSDKTYLLEIDASWQVSPDNRSWVQLNWEAMTGERLRTDLILRLPNGCSEGNQPLRFAVAAPANAYDLKVGVVTNRQYKGDFLEIKRIEFGRLVPKG